MPAKFRLAEIARLVDGQLVGDADVTITGVGTIEDSDEGDLVLVEDPELLDQGEACRAAAILVPPPARSARKPLIVTEDPRLAFSRILELFAPQPSVPVGVHPTALIGRGVHLGRDVAIGPYVVIEDGVRVGDRVVIYPFVFIGREGDVGDETIIYPHVFLGERVSIGKRCIIHAGAAIGADGFGFLQTPQGHKKIPQIGTVVVEDDVEIGANTTVDRATVSATRIGAGTKIDDQVHIAHNCVIGRNCILCGQVGIAGSTVIGDNCVLGGKAAVSDHVRIGDNVTIAGRATVFGDIRDPGIYSGYPARPHHQQLRLLAMTQRLPELQKTVEELRTEIEHLRARLRELQETR